MHSAYGGAGFGRTDDTHEFKRLINELSSSNAVKYVIIGGGYNDIYSTQANIEAGIAECKALIASKFPNATMVIAFIGNTTDSSKASMISATRTIYENAASANNIVMLNNTNVLTNASLFSSDGFHPNEAGQIKIANAVVRAMDAQLL